ncbi:MAG: hypothetical protein Q8N47_11600, partial [Bryobacterales bacterium]|nr:hypothetical protein [Bryobacterales bacterium]
MLLARIAYGQASPTQLRVEIPFGFTAANKEFPSGTYLFKGESAGRISFSSANGKANGMVRIITSLARSSDADDHL